MKKLLLAAALLLPSVSQAHNNLFFPGDAYFSSTWVVEDFDESKSEVKFQYRRLSSVFMACGYAGCRAAKVTGISQSCRNNLRIVNDLLKVKYLKDARIEDVEQKGSDEVVKKTCFGLFLYNRKYDFVAYDLGYKFNENWSSLQTDQMKRSHAIYDGIGSVVWDFQHAVKVPGLTLSKKPSSLEGFMGVDEPIEIDSSKISFVITIGDKLRRRADLTLCKQYMVSASVERSNNEEVMEIDKLEKEAKLSFFVINDRVRYFEMIEGKIVEKPWK